MFRQMVQLRRGKYFGIFYILAFFLSNDRINFHQSSSLFSHKVLFYFFSFSSLSHTNLINEIVESLISDVEWYFQGKMPDYSDIEDYFVESRFVNFKILKFGNPRVKIQRLFQSRATKASRRASPPQWELGIEGRRSIVPGCHTVDPRTKAQTNPTQGCAATSSSQTA